MRYLKIIGRLLGNGDKRVGTGLCPSATDES